jgi:hypothetical protein
MSEHNFHTGGYCPHCLHATGSCTCWERLREINKKIQMEKENEKAEELKLDIATAIEYMTEKRDNALEHFCEKLKTNAYEHDCTMHDALEPVLRINLQLKTLVDCMLTMKFINSENNAINKLNENRNKSE